MIDYQPEAGPRTMVPAAPESNALDALFHTDFHRRLEGLLVPDSSSTGYTRFAVTLGTDFSFTVPNVPAGPYFVLISFDCQYVPGADRTCWDMVEMSGSTPDLSAQSACRLDAALPTQLTNVPVNVTGLEPLTSGGYLALASSQACSVYGRAFVTPNPPVGATSISGTVQWEDPLPQAAKGDVVFVYQKSRRQLGGGAAFAISSGRFARLNNFSLPGSAAFSTALDPPPRTGTLSMDLRWSQFAALSADVHPTATPSSYVTPFVDVLAVPAHNRLLATGSALLAGAAMNSGATTNVNYGTLDYAQFLDSTWRELLKTEYWYDVRIPNPPSTNPIVLRVDITSRVWKSSSPQPAAPVLSPPKTPQINGMDAFASRTGVGTQPVLSWSPPAIGSATSYRVTIEQVVDLVPGTLPVLYARIRSGTSFKVPPQFLLPGGRYIAIISAVMVSGDADRLEMDVDWSDASCVTGVFSP